jgi:SAM-dependent methyltransferase
MTIGDIREALRCPCPAHEKLVGEAPVLACAAADCPRGQPRFPVVGGVPAIVDFADSVIDPARLVADAGGSVVAGRDNRLRRAVVGIAFGRNRVAAVNARRFLDALPARADRPRHVLIVGGGAAGAGVEAIYAAPDVRVVTTDVYRSDLTDLIADGHGLPLADGAVEGVWIQAVLEHVLEPERVVAELWRVLAADGVVYAETPFLQEVHEAAYDFTRFTASGHRWLFRRFAEIDQGVVAGPGTSALWSARALFTALFGSTRLGTAMALPFFWLRLLDRLIPPTWAADAANGVWFLGRRRTESMTPREAIAAYRGAMGRSIT